MTYRFIAILFISCLLFISPVNAQAPKSTQTPVAIVVKTPVKRPTMPQVKRLEPSPTQLALINKYAEQFNVDPKDLIDTIRCESSFDEDVQSRHVKNGVREKSFGLSQINLPFNPDVSYEEAIDPDFAIRFMAYKFSIGKHNMWSCWQIVRPDMS